VRDSNIKYKT